MSADGRKGWVGIDRHWLNDPDLADGDLRLMLWLDSHTDEYLGRLNITTVATQIGWSRNKVKRSLATLIALELISSELLPTKGGGTRTQITLHQSRWSDRDHSDGPQRTTALVHDGPTTTSTPNIEKSTVETPLPPTNGQVVLDPWERAFETFYGDYPRKVGRPAAFRAFKAKVAGMSTGEMREADIGIGRWKRYWAEAGTEMQFIPHPATFLNQERYRDEPPPIVAGNSKSSRSMDAINRLARAEL